MRRFGNPLLSFSALFLILLSIVGILQREGRERVQSLPALSVGTGLIVASAIRRQRRRKILLNEIRSSQQK